MHASKQEFERLFTTATAHPRGLLKHNGERVIAFGSIDRCVYFHWPLNGQRDAHYRASCPTESFQHRMPPPTAVDKSDGLGHLDNVATRFSTLEGSSQSVKTQASHLVTPKETLTSHRPKPHTIFCDCANPR